MQNDSRNTKLLLWANRAIRWGFGILFITIGILNNDESRLYALIFGVAFIITGFFRPRRCLEENCPID